MSQHSREQERPRTTSTIYRSKSENGTKDVGHNQKCELKSPLSLISHQGQAFILPQQVTAQQMQQLLQQPSVMSTHQLQQLLQLQQQTFIQQQQELQKQAQILQQMQTAAAGEGKTNKLQQQQQHHLQALAMQQHLMSQTGQLLLPQSNQALHLSHLGQAMSAAEVQALWKEVSANVVDEKASSVSTGASSSGSSVVTQSRPVVKGIPEGALMHPAGFLVAPPQMHPQGMIIPGEESAIGSTIHPLYGHGMCKWPGCETSCDDFPSFLKHINNEHALDDRSTAQARVQMQVVNQLEIQLAKERERLAAMMAHLHMKPPEPKTSVTSSASPPAAKSVIVQSPTVVQSPPAHLPPPPAPQHIPPPQTLQIISSSPNMPSPHSHPPPPASPIHTSISSGPIRRRMSEKYGITLDSEIQKNCEFYRNADVRPPFTYAALIRQAIVESPVRQLTLNEIYNWFTRTFAYFRRNAATWKNAVRHNLSLHKCFVRVENVKGAVWTVDELEFMKRRPQKLQISGSLSAPTTPTTPSSPLLHRNPIPLIKNDMVDLHHSMYPMKEIKHELPLTPGSCPQYPSFALKSPGHLAHGRDNSVIQLCEDARMRSELTSETESSELPLQPRNLNKDEEMMGNDVEKESEEVEQSYIDKTDETNLGNGEIIDEDPPTPTTIEAKFSQEEVMIDSEDGLDGPPTQVKIMSKFTSEGEELEDRSPVDTILEKFSNDTKIEESSDNMQIEEPMEEEVVEEDGFEEPPTQVRFMSKFTSQEVVEVQNEEEHVSVFPPLNGHMIENESLDHVQESMIENHVTQSV
ncbi:forkhead box protein P1-like isoform X2 [Anneissia japonica]|uniref:forkhead box protein P1-like isoform X2 n=1 Tax=Anneissia japonica TaxID=1529436 RepID=UPI0014257ECC|nr:forkhead box protein P1-like isoform X2 [Anneissia japonica]